MWKHRELLRNLIVADFKIKYQNTSLGFLWSLLSPFLLALVLYLVFRNVFRGEQYYAVGILVATLAFRFFSVGTSACLSSLYSKAALITTINTPRKILVLSDALSTLITAILEFVILLPIIWWSTKHLVPTIPLFLVAHVLLLLLIYGIGLILGALFIYFRDLAQIWSVLLSVLIFCVPIFYPVSIITQETVRQIYLLNPLTRLIIIYKDVTIYGTLPSVYDFLVVIGFAAFFIVAGNYVFNRLQRRFAEVM